MSVWINLDRNPITIPKVPNDSVLQGKEGVPQRAMSECWTVKAALWSQIRISESCSVNEEILLLTAFADIKEKP